MFIRELRDSTGMTQKAFAERFNIPLSTLRKWEQGETSPAPYVIEMLSALIPGVDGQSVAIECEDSHRYYYNTASHTLSDVYGNVIRVVSDLSEVKKENLPHYVKDLFDSLYLIRDRFNKDCEYDKHENIIWS